ncbi:MAG: YicC family protein, partial [Gemmataceae bacterium]|nr:YicC family protein [Gemmataceae bacterium]
MTGYGEASHQGDRLQIAAEMRAGYNRYLKVTLRAPEPYLQLEPEVEKVV